MRSILLRRFLAISAILGVLGCTSAAYAIGGTPCAREINGVLPGFHPLEDDGMEESPQYSIMSFSDRPVYNPGEEVSIDLYIAGSELVNESRLLCHIPKYIIRGNNVQITAFKFAKSLVGEWEGWKPVLPPEEFAMGYRVVAVLVEGYFTYQTPERILLWSEGEISDPETGRSYAPVSINFVVDNDAPGGDHAIQFQFKHMSSDGTWLVEKDTLNIRIRTLIERITPVVATLLAVVGIVVSAALSAYRSRVERHPVLVTMVVSVIVVVILLITIWTWSFST